MNRIDTVNNTHLKITEGVIERDDEKFQPMKRVEDTFNNYLSRMLILMLVT